MISFNCHGSRNFRVGVSIIQMLVVIKNHESRLSISLDSGSMLLVREHVLFCNSYHQTGS